MKQGIEPERLLRVRMVDLSISGKKRFPAAGILMGATEQYLREVKQCVSSPSIAKIDQPASCKLPFGPCPASTFPCCKSSWHKTGPALYCRRSKRDCAFSSRGASGMQSALAADGHDSFSALKLPLKNETSARSARRWRRCAGETRELCCACLMESASACLRGALYWSMVDFSYEGCFG
jgi:hypothetical protein